MSAIRHETQGLRRMTLQHLDAVLAIELKCYEFPWSRGNFVDSLAAGHLARILCGDDGELIGYFVAMSGAQEMHLLNLSVAPQAQGRGHATAMLGVLVTLCGEHAARQLWLEVRQSNARARAIYRHFGFTELGLRKRYYPAPQGQREDAVVMQLQIAPLATEGIDALD